MFHDLFSKKEENDTFLHDFNYFPCYIGYFFTWRVISITLI
ncbi:hypothetical protein LPE509_01110 [Legionella pneumophila subsp. pneumophila LPE509]|nr:hypothetical protein LPE509_01110 [Legionella pneumophila subsp. pneumophila LPE509]